MPEKSIAEKLLIKAKTTVWTSSQECLRLVGPLPADVDTVDSPEEATTALIFAQDAAAARAILEANKDHLSTPATLWPTPRAIATT